MAAKRLSEYRELAASHGRETLVRYRASFAKYSETSLNVSCFSYALLSSFFLAIFLIKYRIEYLLLMPVIIILFGYYHALAMQPGLSGAEPGKTLPGRRVAFCGRASLRAVRGDNLLGYPFAQSFHPATIYQHTVNQAPRTETVDWADIELVVFDVDGTLHNPKIRQLAEEASLENRAFQVHER